MKILPVFLLFALSFPAFAAPAQNGKKGGEIHAESLDADFPIERVRQLGAKDRKPQSKMLPPEVLEQFLRESGVAEVAGSWDEFEKDRFSQRVLHFPVRVVFEQYESRIPLGAIEKFKSLAESYRRKN